MYPALSRSPDQGRTAATARPAGSAAGGERQRLDALHVWLEPGAQCLGISPVRARNRRCPAAPGRAGGRRAPARVAGAAAPRAARRRESCFRAHGPVLRRRRVHPRRMRGSAGAGGRAGRAGLCGLQLHVHKVLEANDTDQRQGFGAGGRREEALRLRQGGQRASCFSASIESIPGSAEAIFLKRACAGRAEARPVERAPRRRRQEAKERALRALMLKPAFALVSMNITPYSRAFASPSSMETWLQKSRGERTRGSGTGGGAPPRSRRRATSSGTRRLRPRRGGAPHRFSTRSVLFPTSMTMTSLPRSVRTSSIQRAVFRNDVLSAGGASVQYQGQACVLKLVPRFQVPSTHSRRRRRPLRRRNRGYSSE